MTLKEKIMKLQTYKMFTGEDTVYVERDDVLKLLEQEPCEDCVSREEVLKIYDEWFATCNIADRKASPKAKINALPPATPIRPRKGEWCKQNDDYYDWYECSECGYGSEGEMQYSSEYDVRTNFCPNCGADMRGDEE